MKLPRFARLLLLLALAASLPAFTGCASLITRLHGVETAITGQSATLTVEIVGVTVDAIMKDAAKARHNGDITAAQWDKIAALHGRYLVIYGAEVHAIETAHASNAPSGSLLSLLAEFKTLAESFTKTPAK